MWVGFAVFVVVAIAVDLLVMEKQGSHKVTMKEAALWSVLWFSLSFVFVGLLWWYLNGSQGREVANTVSMQFITGYLVEKSLSIDNIFVFLMIFSYFAVPEQYQKRALIIGIIGAIVLRAILILAGAWLLATFHWLLYVFGAFLVITGVKMWIAAGQEPDIADNPVLKFLKKHIKISDRFDGEKLTTVVNGVKLYTPLFVVLVMLGATDVIFAVDSIPAIFAITSDPFIVLTANIFAILGLRALYFLLADMASRFHLLAYGLALVLVFIGGKMLLVDFYKIPIGVALMVTAGLIIASVVASVVSSRSGHSTPSRPQTMGGVRAIPPSRNEQRDSDGRLIAVTLESERFPASLPAGSCWLVALDGSGHALHALTQAMRLAKESGVPVLDLVNAQPWLSKEASESHLAQYGWAVATDACAILDANGVGWRLHVRMGEAVDSIVQQAASLSSRGIVIGARGLSTTENLLLGSVAQQVIHAAQGVVLVVRAPSGLRPCTAEGSLVNANF
ncbi:hypothetical protein GCM10027032_35380 [Simplicispira piscis]